MIKRDKPKAPLSIDEVLTRWQNAAVEFRRRAEPYARKMPETARGWIARAIVAETMIAEIKAAQAGEAQAKVLSTPRSTRKAQEDEQTDAGSDEPVVGSGSAYGTSGLG